MIKDIRANKYCGLGKFVAGLILWFGIFAYLPEARASDDLETDVQKFLGNFFEVARRYDVLQMIELVSRSTLASNLTTVVQSSDEDTIMRSVRLLFNAEFTFAISCRIHILEYKKLKSEARARLWLERTIDRPGTGPVYDFFLVKESGNLKLDRMIFSHEGEFSDMTADIDLCDIPLDWDNPALLKPGESPQEQQRRLGIP